jgi:hypothetical protein
MFNISKLALLGLVFAGSAAQARMSTVNMTCEEARSTVQSYHAIVLSTGSDTFDRFVISDYYCARNEETQPAWAPTLDSAQCFVGYTCEWRRSE